MNLQPNVFHEMKEDRAIRWPGLIAMLTILAVLIWLSIATCIVVDRAKAEEAAAKDQVVL